jgi:hypothetical protein
MSFVKQVAISAPLVALFALAQSPTSVSAGGDAGGSGASYGLSNTATRSVTKTLSRGGAQCRKQPPVYRYDCYRLVYRRAANQLQGNSAYSEAQQALELVERSLEAAVAQNRDSTQPYTPVKPAAIPRVKRAAIEALEQAETILLRSPANKQEHYTRIAEAINSNKVLLRSALLPGGMIRFAQALITGFLRQG